MGREGSGFGTVGDPQASQPGGKILDFGVNNTYIRK